MAHLWIETADGWAAAPLAGDAFLLRADPDHPLSRIDGPLPPGAVALRQYRAEDGSEAWALLFPPGVSPRINGRRACLGIHILGNRDEIRLVAGGPAVYFSAERLAQTQPYPDSREVALCPRCRQPIQRGHPAVLCPACDTWHHQSSDLPCWTYAPTCALCPQPTALNSRWSWTPESL